VLLQCKNILTVHGSVAEHLKDDIIQKNKDWRAQSNSHQLSEDLYLKIWLLKTYSILIPMAFLKFDDNFIDTRKFTRKNIVSLQYGKV